MVGSGGYSVRNLVADDAQIYAVDDFGAYVVQRDHDQIAPVAWDGRATNAVASGIIRELAERLVPFGHH